MSKFSSQNGSNVVRIGRKGIKKFAFGDDEPFDVDVVVSFHQWLTIDDSFRNAREDRSIPIEEIGAYHESTRRFVDGLRGEYRGNEVTVAEALDFLARLREEYDELADFFRPKLREKQGSPDTTESESELVFTEEN